MSALVGINVTFVPCIIFYKEPWRRSAALQALFTEMCCKKVLLSPLKQNIEIELQARLSFSRSPRLIEFCRLLN